MKISYSFMQHMSKIYKGQLTLCNCQIKGECPMDGRCQTVDAVYDCSVTSPEPQKIYFRLAEGKWKQR